MRMLRINQKTTAFINAIWLSGLLSGCYATTPPGELGGIGSQGNAAAKCLAPDEADRLADQVLELINLERATADLPPAVHNPVLSKIASDYACRMIEEGFFGHEDPLTGHGPSDRAITHKYPFYAVGENLAAGPETPAEVMRAWMDSPSHRDIILDERWTEVGIAVRTGGEFSVYWVQEFGDPANFPLTLKADD